VPSSISCRWAISPAENKKDRAEKRRSVFSVARRTQKSRRSGFFTMDTSDFRGVWHPKGDAGAAVAVLRVDDGDNMGAGQDAADCVAPVATAIHVGTANAHVVQEQVELAALVSSTAHQYRRLDKGAGHRARDAQGLDARGGMMAALVAAATAATAVAVTAGGARTAAPGAAAAVDVALAVEGRCHLNVAPPSVDGEVHVAAAAAATATVVAVSRSDKVLNFIGAVAITATVLIMITCHTLFSPF